MTDTDDATTPPEGVNSDTVATDDADGEPDGRELTLIVPVDAPRALMFDAVRAELGATTTRDVIGGNVSPTVEQLITTLYDNLDDLTVNDDGTISVLSTPNPNAPDAAQGGRPTDGE